MHRRGKFQKKRQGDPVFSAGIARLGAKAGSPIKQGDPVGDPAKYQIK